MSTKHSPEFKAQIALEAVSLPVGDLEEFAKSKGVSKNEVIEWVDTLRQNSTSVFTEGASGGHHHASGENVDLETNDEELSEAVSYGVHHDELNYKQLFFWSTFGTALVVVIIVGLIEFSEMSYFNAQQKASVSSDYSEIKEIKAQDQETLNSYGVVDSETGTYRIPIDQAIEEIAED